MICSSTRVATALRFSSPFGRLITLAIVVSYFITPLCATIEKELKDESGKTIVKYVIEVPDGIAPAGSADPAQHVGLILCFQEHDTPTGNDLFPVRQSLWRQGILDHYILLAAAPQGRKFGPQDHEPLERLIAWAKKTYPINPRRVYMYGKGEGAKISAEFTMTHPNIVTAAIMYSWGAWLMPSELKEPLDFVNSAPEIYLTLGRRDLDHHLACVRDAHIRLKAKGYHIIYREFDELGDRTYHPPSNDNAIAWATSLRNKNLPLSPEEMGLLQDFRGALPAPVDGYYPRLALVGGAPAGAVVQRLLDSTDANVRAAAAETCRHAIFSEATTVALAGRLSDPSIRVRRTAIRALAMYADWRYLSATQALIRLATDQNADALDRLDAADAIGYAVRFQVKGVREDPSMFQALISLLLDKEEPLRATAAGILAPLYQTSGHGDERTKAPPEGWEMWLSGITAEERGALKDYDVCNHGTGAQDPVRHFCMGGQSVSTDPASAFRYMLQAAAQGYVPAEAAVAMAYANGKGVQQNYAEAGKWWIKASEGGDLLAARHTWNLFRNGEGVARDRNIANQWAKVIGEPVQAPH
ncbi:MAG TPA: HEAT repeat domain-containing protein [Bryobacteraceae bacterium]|nr:HEAT repeat domain-containing protein [Bryobacteraceae bacterium]